MSALVRVLLSIGTFAGYWALTTFYNASASLALGQVGGEQFANSDAAYIHQSFVTKGLTFGYHIAPWLLVIALVCIWWSAIVKLIKGPTVPTAALMIIGGGLLAGAVAPTPAYAYYSKENWPEVYMIMPNETAFWIPDLGANKDSQAKFESEAYYNDSKVAQKLFDIKHRKWEGSGTWSDYWVPAGRLIIVDRSPYVRQWVDSKQKGTSSKPEGFDCQSKEGINITVGVALGVNVTPENAAKFLYNFGVLPPQGDRTKPETIFTSVYFGRSLTQVMDDVGKMKVHTLVCNEIGKRSFDEANKEMIPIMAQVEKDSRAYFDNVGITLSFIGWGDTYNFDKPIQDAINSRFITQQDAANYALLQPYANDIKTYALAKMLNASKLSDYHGPQTIMGMDPSILGLAGTMLNIPERTVARPGPTAAPVK